jgi:hypothetical protein
MLASSARCNLLSFCDLASYSLRYEYSSAMISKLSAYLYAEIFKRETFDLWDVRTLTTVAIPRSLSYSIDAEHRVRLNNGKSSGYYKNQHLEKS